MIDLSTSYIGLSLKNPVVLGLQGLLPPKAETLDEQVCARIQVTSGTAMRTDILKLIAAFALVLSLATCNRDNSHRVTERIDRYVDKDGPALDGNPPPDYDHD